MLAPRISVRELCEVPTQLQAYAWKAFPFYLLLYPPWRRQWHPTPVLLPGKSHGQRSLVGSSPRGRYESDTTERLPFHFSLSCIGEGNGNPLQCSGLENPRDGGAWWAAVYGVEQSRTQLKWLSSSSSSLYLGEGSSIPLQCSCLENPLDRGAWWAAVHGVAHSWTQLKRLSIACYPPLPRKQFFLHDPADMSGTWWNRSHSVAGWVACV